MMETLQALHLIRPAWLLAVIPLVALWYLVRQGRARRSDVQTGIAAHLARALTVGGQGTRRLQPIDTVVVIGVLLAIAVAGPTWSKMPNPLVSETAPLVVALKVTPSMEDTDLAPSRLERARFKILDLIEARAGARTALVAYAGSAHRVAPLTEDPNILRPLLEGLNPAVMPVDGDDAGQALDLALDILSTSDEPGAVLFVLDDLNPASVPVLNDRGTQAQVPLVFLVAAPPGTNLPQLDNVQDATVVQLVPGDGDVAQIERRLRSAHAAALAGDETLQWNDRGWLFAWPAALLCALWFRRGWTMRWVLVVLSLSLVQIPSAARADGWIDWFLTPDQQGRLAYGNKDFARAGDLFEDPMWKGFARYKAGQYDDAITIFESLDTADAAFAQGMAELKSRKYRPAVRSFELALERRPDFPQAARNRDIAIAIVSYVETTREQSDTGEAAGIGADDIVFDNESERGADTQTQVQQDAAAALTADQWIGAIDTDMGDFLRNRFVLDIAADEQ